MLQMKRSTRQRATVCRQKRLHVCTESQIKYGSMPKVVRLLHRGNERERQGLVYQCLDRYSARISETLKMDVTL